MVCAKPTCFLVARRGSDDSGTPLDPNKKLGGGSTTTSLNTQKHGANSTSTSLGERHARNGTIDTCVRKLTGKDGE
jgi:hypothetical protein